MKEQPFENLVRTLRSKRAPFTVVFELTRRCNLRCVHCYLPETEETKEKELGTAEVKSILDDLRKAGCMKLTLTGGEPTLRRDFLEIFSYCHRRGFAVTLFTNGTLLTGRVKKAILRERPYRVEWSLYGTSPEVHEGVTGVRGSFDLAVKNMTELIRQGIPVVMKSVLLRSNHQELGALAELSRRWNIPFQPTFRVFGSLDPNRPTDPLRVRTKDLRALLKREDFKGLRRPEDPPLFEEWPCNAGREACCISAEGKVYPCIALRRECGDLRREPFEAIWRQSPVLGEIRCHELKDYKQCFRCPWREICRFCPGMGFFEHGDMLKPSREICRLTRAAAGKG
jgi:radical SAM protein with 4Fe4S-binding SPASM domain